MLTGRHFLFIPGPTHVPERVLRALSGSMLDHRGPSFPPFSLALLRDLKKIFKTENGQVFIFPSSGTGAWEATLLNTLSPGDEVLTSRFGTFSHLWASMCQRLGLKVEGLDVEWGQGVPLERYAAVLEADTKQEIRAVLACHNETATGVTSDVAGVRRVLDSLNHPALLFVDGVSSIGSIDFRMDEWGVDCAVTGSQKGLMLPAGLGIVAASPKALEARKRAGFKRCYFDFEDMIQSNVDGWFPYTPALADRSLAGAQPFGAFIMRDLLPRVRRELSLPDKRTQTGIDGVSMGGRLALLLGLAHPETFGAVAAVQPAMGPDEVPMLSELAARAQATAPVKLRLVTSDGDYFRGAVEALSDRMRKDGVQHELLVTPGPHDYAYNRGPGSFEMLLWHDRVLRGHPPP